ncbi:MAG: DNA polymerase III subunit alpha [Clostridia bacterium]|nr:DNA polymerase III subunit alpha [Clostridia bacterium]
MSDFVHLHLHSEYSLLDGACRIRDIPAFAAENGHKAVAITDHGAMYGVVAFYNACHAAGIKPIIGCEMYVAEQSRFQRAAGSRPNHLVLLCKNMTGYRNLMYLSSMGFTEGFYGKPRIDIDLLRDHAEGLIALSGCLSGKIPQLLLQGRESEAYAYADTLCEIFGKDNFYIEIQNHGLSDQIRVLPMLVKLAGDKEIPLVATNDCHYLRRGDAKAQATLVCIQTNKTVTEGRPSGFETDEFFYKSTDEMQMLFGKYPGALENTVKIAEQCELTFAFDQLCLPKYPCPDALSPASYLRQLVEAGWKKRLADGKLALDLHSESEYLTRIDYELSVIEKMGYSEYFLIVWDYVHFAKTHGISVGPGRGSGAGSLIAYLIEITDIDPLRFDLLFERFLNPERVSMPDIDVDFCYRRRDEVIRYVAERYGSDHVSQIITFGTLAAKAAVRDVGRALGMPYSEVDSVAKAVPRTLGITLADAMKLPELKEMYQGSEKVRNLLDIAMAIEGMPRNVSVHAAGVVITEKPVSDYVPLATSNDTVVTQYDMDTVARLGILKFDFLALRYLTIIDDAVTQIVERQPEFSVENLPLDDKETYALISAGDTGGVFQLESYGMRQMLQEMKPRSMDDILAAIALYRPGPMDSIPKYIAGRNHPESVKYEVPALKPILSSTYGCIVYQEQVMTILRELGGFSFGHADIVRRAMSKKKASAMESERKAFVQGVCEKGVPESTADHLFDEMAAFANYAFNKSHAAAYAVIAYRTAYLKAHYPREYFAALLTSVLDSQEKMAEYIADCEKRGIHVMPPDINKSNIYFHVSDNEIRFGLAALKNVGRQFVASILEERQRAPFRSFEDFVQRMTGHDLNKRQVETLIKGGAFDALGVFRSRMLAAYEPMIEGMASRNRSNLDGQLDMFSQVGTVGENKMTMEYQYPMLPEISLRERLMQEKDASGMYFSGHLLDDYSRQMATLPLTPLSAFAAHPSESELSETTMEQEREPIRDRQRVIVAGVITSVTRKTTKDDKSMAFFTLEDRYTSVECIIFPGQYIKQSHHIHIDTAVVVEGTASEREDMMQLIVLTVTPLQDNTAFRPSAALSEPKKPALTAKEAAPRPKRLFLRVESKESKSFRKAVNLIEIFEGNIPVVFYQKEDKSYFAYSRGVALSDFLLAEFKSLLGDDNVIYQ